MYAQYKEGNFIELAGNFSFADNVFQPAETLSDEQRVEFSVFNIVDHREELPPFHVYAESWTYEVIGPDIHRHWSIVPMNAEQMAVALDQIKTSITSDTQQRLDTFASTRGYDGILSACTYATSTIDKFKIEGQYCVNMRDATWMVLYSIMADVQAGNRPMPMSYADVESELPDLEWPQ
jgi:hypothetical protein